MTHGGNQTGSLLTVKEVSQLLHVHSNTLRRWSNQGIIRVYRIGPRGDRRYLADDIAGLLFEENHDRDAPPGEYQALIMGHNHE